MAERLKRVLADRAGGYDFEFVGGWGWLDFVNTELVEQERVVDLLGSFEDLVVWLEEAEMLGLEEAGCALERWVGTEEGRFVLSRAGKLRGTLRKVAEGFVRGDAVGPGFVEEINALLAQRLGRPELVETEDGFEVRFRPEPDGPDGLLSPVAESAARFLARAEPSLVKGCENPGCILFFYDSTKNHGRRWCSMATCGNRMKARAHYERLRARDREHKP